MGNSKHYDYLIIGADAAGLSAAVQIRSLNKEATICILDKNGIISYGACGLPYAIDGTVDSFESLIHFTAESFSNKYHADVLTFTEAISASFKDRTVTAKSSSGNVIFAYDRLIIATGAEPIKLPFLDYNSPRVMELKTIPDGQKIKDALASIPVKDIVIIGAGYIGLEMADVLAGTGIKVTIVDIADGPVPRLPTSIGKSILSEAESRGIKTFFGTKIDSASISNDSVVLHTTAGDIQCDAVISAIGIRPATEFLKETELSMDRGAIIVDSKCRTNIENVFSAGDCAMVYHRLLKKNTWMPLGSTANKQGRIAGMNSAGKSIEFPGIIGTQIFKFFDTVYAKTGLTEDEAKENGIACSTVSAIRPGKAGYYPGAGKVHVYMTVSDNGTILGGHMIGPLHTASMIDAIGVMAQMGMNATDAAYFDAAYAPPFAPVWNAMISTAGKFGLKGGSK